MQILRVFAALPFFVLFGCAVLRWEIIGIEGLIWLFGSFLVGLIRSPYARRVRDNQIVEDKKDFSESALLIGMFAAMGAFPLAYLATGFPAVADYDLPSWASALGIALQVPFLWLFWRSHADLGRNWSVSLEIREGHKLVTTGVYSVIRHPMYAAIWIGAVSQALLVQNWIGGAFVLVAFLAMHMIRIPKEEAMMRARFGQAYEDYAARTGAVFPALTLVTPARNSA